MRCCLGRFSLPNDNFSCLLILSQRLARYRTLLDSPCPACETSQGVPKPLEPPQIHSCIMLIKYISCVHLLPQQCMKTEALLVMVDGMVMLLFDSLGLVCLVIDCYLPVYYSFNTKCNCLYSTEISFCLSSHFRNRYSSLLLI